MKQVEVYTDGACSGNPGPGGWGAVLRYRFNGKVYEKELTGSDDSTILAALPQETLARLIVPLGDFAPEDVAEMAEDFKV